MADDDTPTQKLAIERCSPREEFFCRKLIEGASLRGAYRAAFPAIGFEESTIDKKARAVLTKPSVAHRLAELQDRAAATAAIDVGYILREMATLATIDPAEIFDVRNYCCRHCWGIEFGYQWTDANEFNAAMANYERAHALWERASKKGKTDEEPKEPSDKGGYEFKKALPPNPECPMCDGAGWEQRVSVRPFEKIPAHARRLIAGVKQGKYGVEVSLRDQTTLLRTIGEHLGMFNRGPVPVVPVNPDGSPMAPPNDGASAAIRDNVRKLSDQDLSNLEGLLQRALAPRDNSAATDVSVKEVTDNPTLLPIDMSKNVPR